MRNVARRTDMQAVHLEDITAHYVETLRRWRHRFFAAAPELAQLGYDRRFRRLWTLYLAYCEAGFAERRICDLAAAAHKASVAGTGQPAGPRARRAGPGGRGRRVTDGRASLPDALLDRTVIAELYEPRLRAAQPALG